MSSSAAPPTSMGDPVVPILDIPPDESLNLSEETVAAVTAVAPAGEGATPAGESALGGEAGVQGVAEFAPMETDTAVATFTTTTTTTTTTTVPPASNTDSSGNGGVGREGGAGEGQSVMVETVVEKSSVPVTVEWANGSDQGAAVELKGAGGVDDGIGIDAAEISAASEESEPMDILLRKETTTTVTIVTDPPAGPPAEADMGDDLVIGGAAAAGVEDEPSILDPIPVLGKTKRQEEEVGGIAAEESDDLDGSLVPPLKRAKSDADAEVVDEIVEVAVGDAVPQENLTEMTKEGVPVQLGPRTFNSGVEMFQYFYNLLHSWVPNVDLNKYEQMVLLDLIRKGHRDPEAKIGPGIKSFQVRFHPGWHSRCYYLTQTDGAVDDFSYRKCIDKIMPLPASLYSSSGDLDLDKILGAADKWKKGKGKGSAREVSDGQGGKNRGRGGKWRGGRGGGRWNRN